MRREGSTHDNSNALHDAGLAALLPWSCAEMAAHVAMVGGARAKHGTSMERTIEAEAARMAWLGMVARLARTRVEDVMRDGGARS